MPNRSSYAALFYAFPLTFVSLVLGCSSSSSDSENDSPVDCKASTVPTFAQVTGFEKCTSCHSSTLTGVGRSDAPQGINYDNYTDAKTYASRALDEIEEGAMPPAGSPALTPAELEVLKLWASCGTPQ